MKEKSKHKSLDELYHTPANLRLKYIALTLIAVSIALIVGSAFWQDDLSQPIILIMQGCAGLFALAFVAVVGFLVYRVNSTYINQRLSDM